MNIAVLTLHDIADFPIQDWIDLSQNRVVIFADHASQRPGVSKAVLQRGVTHVELYHNYINNGRVDSDVVSMHRAVPFDSIISFGEDDVIRTARLREYLGISGQSVNSAQMYRDKLLMKEAAQKAGIAVPQFTKLNSPLDVIAFQELVKLPYFVKPRTSSGSTMARAIRNESDVLSFLEEGFQSRIPLSEYVPDLILEEFVDGHLYHIDGFVFENQVASAVASKYGHASLELDAIGNGSVFSYNLAAENELSVNLIAYTKKVIAAMDSPSSFSFHAEVFVREDGTLLLCEIACRTGGARVNDAYRATTGFDLNQLSFLSQIDLGQVRAILNHPTQPLARHAAWTLVCPQRARLLSVPDMCPLPGIVDFKVHMEAGYESVERQNSSHRIASAIVLGSCENDTVDGVKAFNDWFTAKYLELT